MAFGIVGGFMLLLVAVYLVHMIRRLKAGLGRMVSFTAITRGEVEAPRQAVWDILTDITNPELRDLWGSKAEWVDRSAGHYTVKDGNGNGSDWHILEDEPPARSVRQYEAMAGHLRGLMEIELSEPAPGRTAITITHHCDLPSLLHKVFRFNEHKEHAAAFLAIEGSGKALGVPARAEGVDIALSDEPLVEPMPEADGPAVGPGRFGEERV